MVLKHMNNMKSRWLPVAVFSLLHILIIALLFNSGVYGQRYSAAGLFMYFADHVFYGQVVYRDFAMEYPPLSLFFFLLPRLFSSNLVGYTIGFTVEVIIFDLAGLAVVAAMSRRVNLSPWVALPVYTMALLALGPLVADRYDLFPAVLTLLALYAYSSGRHKLAWSFLALGTMTKLYPVVIAPIFLIDSWRAGRLRSAVAGIITFVVITAAMMLPFLWLAPGHTLDFLGYHTQRGLQVETIYASFLLLGHALGLTAVQLNFSFGGWNVTGHLADSIGSVATIVVVLSLLAVYWLVFRRGKAGEKPDDAALINYSSLAVLAFMLASKVLSPQFLIWLYPLIPLAAGKWRYVTWLLFIIIGLATFYIFPTRYVDLVTNLAGDVIAMLFLRNMMMVGLGWVMGVNKNVELKIKN